MLVKIFAVIVAVVVLSAATATYAQDTETHGFSFSTASTSEEGLESKFHRGHTWLIWSKSLGELEAFAIIAPIGPPKYLHNLQVNWKNPVKGLSNITLGRTQPAFGSEWVRRIDRLPTINYSSITKPLVARDVGVSANGQLSRLNWTLGVFSGQRTGGNVPISERGELDGYVRLIGTLPLGVKAGASARLGPVPAFGGNLSWQFKKLALTGEITNSKNVTAYYYLLEYTVTKHLATALRYEHLAAGERVFTSGLAFKPWQDNEVKLNYIASKQEADVFLSQLVLRW